MADDVLADARTRMTKAVESAAREFETIRSGRANPRLVESLKIDYYGQPTPLQQLAGVHAPEAHQLLIQPYDRTLIVAIEKAIRANADLSMNPSNDGAVIRIAIPPLNEQRRKELVKVAHKKAEEGHVAVRNIRRDAHDTVRKQEKSHEISEDESRRLQEQLQKITDENIARIDAALKAKEAEIMEV